MKTIINYIIAGILFLSVSGCEKDPQLPEHIADGYYRVSAEFITSLNNKEYYIVLNTDTLQKGRSHYVERDENVLLQVFEKGNTHPVYKEELIVDDNKEFQFIKRGDVIDTYHKDKYIQFSIDIKWANIEDREKYKVSYMGVELSTEQFNKNYVLNTELTGILKIQKIDNGSIVLEKKISVENEGTNTLLQVSDTEFLTVPSGIEEAPISDDYKKIRIYYTKNNELKEDSYMIRFYAFDGWVYEKDQAVRLSGEFEIRAGEISPYISVYGRTFEQTTGGVTYLTYDLMTKDGTIVRRHDPNQVALQFDDQDWNGDYFKFLNKFETFNISGSVARLVLSEKW